MKERSTISKFTENDILRYFYGEMPENEKIAFEQALMTNSKLRRAYKELTFTLGMLPDIENTGTSPEPEILQNILEFSKSTLEHKFCQNNTTENEKTFSERWTKIRKYTSKTIIAGLAVLLSGIVSFSGYSQYKQSTHKKIASEALEWEFLDNKEIEKLNRDVHVLKEHRGGILPTDSAIYELVTHDESNIIVLP
ncbi:MAG: hypothetical protein NZ519_11200 [Bacteroidia bacterium]|nr:hypothetical protein [Bacteroidia bacterium]